MKKRQIIIAVVVIILLIAGGIYRYMSRQEQANVYTGTVETTQVNVTTSLSGYLESMDIKDGMEIKKGQKVASIRRKDVNAQVQKDRAALAQAKFNLLNLEQGSRSAEKEVAQANVEQARTKANQAQDRLARMETLLQEGAVARQTYDDAKANAQAAEAAWKAAQGQASLVNEGNRQALIDAAREQVKQMEAVVMAGESMQGDTTIYAPIDGLVQSKNFEVGEYVNMGAVLGSIISKDDTWVKVYVSEPMLGKIKIGQKVPVYSDAYPKETFEGTIIEISQQAEFTPRLSVTKNERANMVFFVKVKLNNEKGNFKAGTPVDVRLDE